MLQRAINTAFPHIGVEVLKGGLILAQGAVDAGELVYLYPFALDGVDQKKAVERDSVDRAVAGLASIGLDSAAAHELDLNDLWDRSDAPEAGSARAPGAFAQHAPKPE